MSEFSRKGNKVSSSIRCKLDESRILLVQLKFEGKDVEGLGEWLVIVAIPHGDISIPEGEHAKVMYLSNGFGEVQFPISFVKDPPENWYFNIEILDRNFPISTYYFSPKPTEGIS